MIDLKEIGRYRENNRIEAKKALGGLPHSIWETYSAFANTLGGVILLGVEEHRDKSLHPVSLPDPEGMVKEFWDLVSSPQKASANILTRRHIEIAEADGCRIIAIHVPRARRFDRPVYVDGNPFTGTYRRNGEGDYRCTREEVLSMQRDSETVTRDMELVESLPLEVLNADSISRYRERMESFRPGHPWCALEDVPFLEKLGAAGTGAGGRMHPTAAGLLMFGQEYAILSRFPGYSLDYREQEASGTPWLRRIASSSGTWSGNLHDFYFLAGSALNVFPGTDASGPVCKAMREALANCLINADYEGQQGIVIHRLHDRITFSNPGAFRLPVSEARKGGVSDPRNSALTRMFSLIDVGEGTGGGLPGIFEVWQKQGWDAPVIEEKFTPERITLTLPFCSSSSPRAEAGRSRAGRQAVRRAAVIDYLTEHVTCTAREIADLLGTSPRSARALLSSMLQEGIIVQDPGSRTILCRLKA